MYVSNRDERAAHLDGCQVAVPRCTMGDEVQNCVRAGLPWNKLPKNIKQMLGNSQREYDKIVVDHSIRNQLRYRGNLVRHVRRNEEQYYELLVRNSRATLMLYPYHLSDVTVRGLRVTPFQYYVAMMQDLMSQERSYDSLPNFTAADCLRLLGVGRNQYIDLMNQCRSAKKVFRRRMAAGGTADVLPRRPIDISIEPWWMVQVGSVMEEDIKSCARMEKDVVDMLIDEGAQLVGTLDASVVQKLYHKGLVYFDVPITDTDIVVVPPLDGFVMNRVLGDYFETLLYKVFVSIDEHTTVAELAQILDIDLQLVKNAVSVFCRLGFAYKRTTGLENLALHVTWAKYMKLDEQHENSEPVTLKGDAQVTTEPLSISDELLRVNDDLQTITPSEDGKLLSDELDNEQPNADGRLPDSSSSVDALSATISLTDIKQSARRFAFLFDSTLTAFLMMGNLSPGLKNHAVTLFEVGKLADEALDNFIDELSKVHEFGEGEAKRYFEHAQTLRSTLVTLRRAHGGLDLVRCESLSNLDPTSRSRVLQKNYRLLLSMAPLTAECAPVSSGGARPPHLGPPLAAANSSWFRLFIYETVGVGPASVLFTKGSRVRRLPRHLSRCPAPRQVLLSTWCHEPGLMAADSCLVPLNDALLNSAVFLQAYSDLPPGTEVMHVPFPLLDNEQSSESSENGPLHLHPSILKLNAKLNLRHTCGYATMLRIRQNAKTVDAVQRKEALPNDERVLTEGAEVGAAERPPEAAPGPPNVLALTAGCTSMSRDPRRSPACSADLSMAVVFDEWLLFDFMFGVPLFDGHLNRAVCERATQSGLFEEKRFDDIVESNRRIGEMVLEFISRYLPDSKLHQSDEVPHPVTCLAFDRGKVSTLRQLQK